MNSSSFQSLVSTCAHMRKVQLPARAFQLQTRVPSRRAVTQISPITPTRARLHTLHKYSQDVEHIPISRSYGRGKQSIRVSTTSEETSNHTSKETLKTRERSFESNAAAAPRVREYSSVDKNTTSETQSSPNSTVPITKSYAREKRPPNDADIEIARRPFREYMRRVSHPVAIVTATDTNVDTRGGPDGWRGATVSSFNSVALEPNPYVSFNIKKVSSTFDAIRNSNLFAVHVMSISSQATDLATHFSRGNDGQPFRQKLKTGGTKVHPFVRSKDGWAVDAATTSRRHLPPILQWRRAGRPRAVLFSVLCEYQADKLVEVGDHVVVVGKVTRVIGNLEEEAEQAQYATAVPSHSLLYGNGTYFRRGTGETLKQQSDSLFSETNSGGKVSGHGADEDPLVIHSMNSKWI